jgi:hypothetical protein
MPSSVDVRDDVRDDELKDHSSRLYWLKYRPEMSVQHFSGAGSTSVAVLSAGERPDTSRSIPVDPETTMILRLMTARRCSTGLIAATLGVTEDDARDLAAALDLIAPQDGSVRLAPDTAHGGEAGNLRTGARLYTPRQLAFLAKSWLTRATIPEIACDLGRSESAIKRKLRGMGFLQRQRTKAWDDLETLRGLSARQSAERRLDAMLSGDAAPVPRRRSKFRWTVDRTALLCTRWLEGWTPAAIARALGTTPGSVSTRATRACLPARTRTADGRLFVSEVGHVCLDKERQEYFWSRRQTARQSAYRASSAAASLAMW